MLILTTREHILAEAVTASERLKDATLSAYRYVVEVSDCYPYERARILYNHAYFNGLSDAFLDELMADDFYLEIISHPKFSPRLIEWMTTPRRLKACKPGGYRAFALRLLDDPAEIWDYAYKRQISHAARSLLLAVYSLGQRCYNFRLREAFESLHRLRAERYNFRTSPDDFLSAMRVLSGSFIVERWSSIDFIDPSVRDLMNAILVEANENCVDVLAGAVDMVQVGAIWRLSEREKSGAIRDAMATRFDVWGGGLNRALGEFSTYSFDGQTHIVAYHLEERLSLIIEVAAELKVDAIRSLIPGTIARVSASWEQDSHVDYPVALQALRGLGSASFLLTPDVESARLALRSALMRQRRYELSPLEVNELLELEPELDLTLAEKEALRLASFGWRRRVGDWLRDCQSESELVALKATLVRLGRILDLNLYGLIAAVETEISMYVEPDLDEPDPWDRAQERAWESAWRRAPFEGLFESLRQDRD